ncbi:uncharacterized protein EI97DRAFT_430362 [Westerdykella ornata]|uniref:Uncharacterized protein n=1 Tax=Westerdykella ornata TaxID=318751 RepID=A0A6A6JTV4_WESOR|nr:uncharacterized protein EI97DRAFT_430362 [Westerdykella ornata]KAF2279268.1 hypothetical protein EI97DRAFT_430362 [Westerdykella ornata]
MAEIPPYPLYNRTYLLCRVSPLHTGGASLFDDQVLRSHAQRLKSQLKGDNIRGVEVDYGGSENALGKLGPLEECTWQTIGDEDDWITRHRHLVDPDASQLSAGTPAEQARGIQVTLEYEKTAYNALLLRDPSTTTSPEGFTSLPLLMLKMPAPIRTIFIHYLSTAFDAHVSTLRLPSTVLISTLESYFRRLSAPNSTQTIPDVIRQLQIQLSFPTTTTLLKHIDITLSAADVPLFVKRGKSLRPTTDTPFTSALSLYLQTHLALTLSHPDVHITKITCAPITLSTDRVKISVPEVLDVSMSEGDADAPEQSPAQLALQDLYEALVREAAGTGKFLDSSSSPHRDEVASPPTPFSSDSNPGKRAANRKRAVSTTSTANVSQPKRNRSRAGIGSGAVGDVEMRDT